MIKLPDGRTEPTARMSDDIWLIYGLFGVGKTTLALQYPNTLVLATEAGCKGVSAHVVGLQTWQDFLDALALLARKKDKKDGKMKFQHAFRTVIIDTANVLRDMCEIHVCKANGCADPGDTNDHGLVWRKLRREWQMGLKRLNDLGLCVVLLAHEKKRPVMVERGSHLVETGQHYITTSLSESARGVLHSHVDHIMRLSICDGTASAGAVAPGERWLLTEHRVGLNGGDVIEAKTRGTLGGPCLPPELPATFEALQAAYRAAFNGSE